MEGKKKEKKKEREKEKDEEKEKAKDNAETQRGAEGRGELGEIQRTRRPELSVDG